MIKVLVLFSVAFCLAVAELDQEDADISKTLASPAEFESRSAEEVAGGDETSFWDWSGMSQAIVRQRRGSGNKRQCRKRGQSCRVYPTMICCPKWKCIYSGPVGRPDETGYCGPKEKRTGAPI